MDLKRWLVAARYFATLPSRRMRNTILAASGRAPVIVLFYHRVADQHPNDWTIDCRLFRQQMEWLSRHFDMISLSEAQDRIRSGCNARAAVSVTFDDGYADNCEFALPYLLAEGIPCTYFVATQHLLTGAPFQHDIDAGVKLAPNNADQIADLAASGIEIGAHTRTHCDLGKITDHGRLYSEIVGSGDELAEITGRPIRYFAFPFGQLANINQAAICVAKQAGYQAVFSAFGGYNLPGQPEFFFRRIHGDPEMFRFKNWLTFDPRKHVRHGQLPPMPSDAINWAEQDAMVTDP